MTGEFDAGAYKDEYREALLKVIEAKVEGHEIRPPEPVEESGNLVDLMKLLEASVKAATERRPRAPRSRCRWPTRRRPREKARPRRRAGGDHEGEGRGRRGRAPRRPRGAARAPSPGVRDRRGASRRSGACARSRPCSPRRNVRTSRTVARMSRGMSVAVDLAKRELLPERKGVRLGVEEQRAGRLERDPGLGDGAPDAPPPGAPASPRRTRAPGCPRPCTRTWAQATTAPPSSATRNRRQSRSRGLSSAVWMSSRIASASASVAARISGRSVTSTPASVVISRTLASGTTWRSRSG